MAKVLDVRRVLSKQLAPLAVIVIFAFVLRHRIAELDFENIRTALGTVGPGQWVLGCLLTGVSFWALGQYDVVGHRLVGRDTQALRAACTGMIAIAIGQTVGMGALTGAFVRWRMLPGLGLLDATRISAFVSVSFLAGWAVVAATAVLIWGVALPHTGLIAGAVLGSAYILAMISLWRPGALARLPIPSLKAMALILAFTTIDTFAAGAVLWAMLPDGLSIAFGPLFAAYILSLGAGLVLTTPGGVGPFEVAMLALLPDVPTESLLAAILVYRAVYYAGPAIIGAILLARPPARPPLPKIARTGIESLDVDHLPLKVEAALDSAPRAEAALLRHGRFALLSNQRDWPTALVAQSGQSLIMLGDPLALDAQRETLLGLIERARFTLTIPVVYKCGARLAVHARAREWHVIPVAKEGWLDPQTFNTSGPARSTLRRKLRKADGTGLMLIVIAPNAPQPLPLAEMKALAEQWRRARGGERGFSMGVWDPDHLRHAMIVLARDTDGVLVGFITLHVNQNEVTLDLMRQSETPPDGLMYLLVTEAIHAAAELGVRRFSFASVPYGAPVGEQGLFQRLRGFVDDATGAEGLRQFKAAFAPNWETLYLAAPSRSALLLGAVDLVREITRQERRD